MTSFPAVRFLLDLIDKAHNVDHENNFFIFFSEEVQPIL